MLNINTDSVHRSLSIRCKKRVFEGVGKNSGIFSRWLNCNFDSYRCWENVEIWRPNGVDLYEKRILHDSYFSLTLEKLFVQQTHIRIPKEDRRCCFLKYPSALAVIHQKKKRKSTILRPRKKIKKQQPTNSTVHDRPPPKPASATKPPPPASCHALRPDTAEINAAPSADHG